jgi:hypothetical protein
MLIDFALASHDELRPWLTFDEAAKLFGDVAETARQDLASSQARMQNTIGTLTVVLGISLSVVLWLALRLADIAKSVDTPAAIALAFTAMTFAVGATTKGRVASTASEAFGVFFATLALLATAVAVNNTVSKPLISDLGGLVAGALVASAATVIWVLARKAVASRKKATQP